MDFTSAKKKHELMVEKQVTPMATRSNFGIHTTRTPAPTPEEQKKYTCKEIDKPLPDSFFKEECIESEYSKFLQHC